MFPNSTLSASRRAATTRTRIYRLQLDQVTVAGVVSESGHDTAVAFDYSRAKEKFFGQNPDGSPSDPVIADVDTRDGARLTDVSHDTLATFAHDHADGSHLTYLTRVAGIDGDSHLDGYTDYIEIDAYAFGILNNLSQSTGTGGGSGSAQLDPLMVDLNGNSPALAKLFALAATGQHVPQLDLVGLKTTGDHTDEIYHLKLDQVTVAGVVSEFGHDSAVAFEYSRVKEEIHGQNPDGSPSDPVIADIDTRDGAALNPVSHDSLTAFAHDHTDGSHLTYLMRVAGIDGDSQRGGYPDYIEIDAYAFGILNNLSNVVGGGGGAGKPDLDPSDSCPQRQLSGACKAVCIAASGQHLSQLDLVGLKTTGDHTDESTISGLTR